MMSAAPISGADAAPDLRLCENEPIRIPGLIQPHGVLIALSVADMLVAAGSANLAEATGIDAAAVIGQPMAALFHPQTTEQVLAALRRSEPAGAIPVPVRFQGDPGQRMHHAMMHRQDDLAIIEIEEPAKAPPAPDAAGDLFPLLSAAIDRLQTTSDTAALWAQAVREVRLLTGFDRVKLYRFHADWSGEVVAEDRVDHMPGFLGLHFPASDIPAQARELYRSNPTRIVPDVAYVPVPLLVAASRAGRAVDLSSAQLRSVSPVHLEYLSNMGIGASMSVSVMRGGELWGLIACHHARPLHVPAERRQACRLLAQVLAWQLAVAEEASVARHSADVRALQARVLEETTCGIDHREAILRHAGAMLALMQAGGFALVTPEATTLIGATPAEAAVRDLATWLAGREGSAASFETDRLGLVHPPASAFAAVASGVLAVPVSRPPRQMMMWFRPEVAQTVTWGGDPHKPMQFSPDGPDRLTPRRSFAAWQQTVSGRSRPWQPHELVAAGELRDLVLDVLVRRAEELEHINVKLARSNEELEAFAYVAAHDIREPLRQIETFASMLERAVGGGSSTQGARIGRWVEGIEASSRRLRMLIDDLTEFSRLGRSAQPLAPTSLGEILVDVESDLAPAIAEAGAVITTDEELPLLYCDPGQLRRVLQNLLSNAIKYRHPERKPRISITVSAMPGESTPSQRPMLCVGLADNGIGFEPRFSERIFEPFQRLHGADRYPGSGIGLAICRKIIDRHGGVISAEGRPGEGTIIRFTLPTPPVGSP
ncbi:ATP-binding protein [Falsiroseomonas sp. E2-1-a4]|uniref:ATP-binding protein n=1 Tax=Falsiroseomonas sp. E2-1-a4 TaxID=3239299 RepID=UPI003F3F2D16